MKKAKAGQRGAILGLVLIFMIVVTILGYGLMHLSGLNAVEVVKAIDSSEAFCISDAGLTKGIDALPVSIHTDIAGLLGEGNYDVDIDPLGYSRWNIVSVGTVNAGMINEKQKTIHAIIGPIPAAITAEGDITVSGNAEVIGRKEPYVVFDFQEIFGMSKADVKVIADYDYTNPPNNKMPVEGITWITQPSGAFMVTQPSWNGRGLLVVDGNFRMTGGTFSGVLWVTGTLDIAAGNPTINGSIFAECGITVSTDITGTARINYDADAIDDAFEDFPTGTPFGQKVIFWEET